VLLNKREKNVAIVLGALGAMFLVYYVIVSPYLDKLNGIEQDTIKAQDLYNTGQALIDRRLKLEPVWQDMINGGLRSDESLAAHNATDAFGTWARFASINFDQQRSEAASQDGPFYKMGFNMDFTVQQDDAVRPVSQFLWAAETSNIPVRIDKVTITSVKEGFANLTVKVNLSTLFMPTGSSANSGSGPVSSIGFN
jgi:hypothetical protein